MPRRIKLTLEYDGTEFKGWQVQNGAEAGSDDDSNVDDIPRTVQGEVERALRLIVKQPVRIAGASRTDTGVHAAGQVASFVVPDELVMPTGELCMALNGNLPKDVSAIAAEEVDMNFHPQRDAVGKRYAYSMISRRQRPSILRRTHWHVRFPLEIEAMRVAAKALIGTHDFTSFATKLADIQEKRMEEGKTLLATVRDIFKIDIHADPEYEGRIVVRIEGSGFLYLMVRTIVGSLVDVGRGYRKPEWMAEALAAKDRRRAGPTAPPQGLCLERVFY